MNEKEENKKRKIDKQINKARVMERINGKEKVATCYMGELGNEAKTRANSKTCPLH